MNLDKKIDHRRIDLMEQEFIKNAHVGQNYDAQDIRSNNDIMLLAIHRVILN